MLGRLLKVSNEVDDYGQLVTYIEFLGRRYIYRDGVYAGWYRA